MKEINNIREEIGEAILHLKKSKYPIKVKTKTIITSYKDGSNDCKIIIEKPLEINGGTNKKEG